MQEVIRENLVPGKEYYLQCFEPSCLPPYELYKMIAKFEKLEKVTNWERACFNNFRRISYRNNPDSTIGYRVELNLNWRFYEIPRHKVQKNMENRAYNMILLELIGDEYFKPIDVI
jgi:hypothetical protein